MLARFAKPSLGRQLAAMSTAARPKPIQILTSSILEFSSIMSGKNPLPETPFPPSILPLNRKSLMFKKVTKLMLTEQ